MNKNEVYYVYSETKCKVETDQTRQVHTPLALISDSWAAWSPGHCESPSYEQSQGIIELSVINQIISRIFFKNAWIHELTGNGVAAKAAMAAMCNGLLEEQGVTL